MRETAERINQLIELAQQKSDFQNVNFGRPYSENGLMSKEQNLRLNLDINKTLIKSNKLFLTSSVLGMLAISHVIEDQAINSGGKFDFYTGCEKFSLLKIQQSRYHRLCQLGNPVTVFTIKDEKTWDYPNLNIVGLDYPASNEESSLANNWFVILNNPQFVSMALVARKLPSKIFTAPKSKRVIYRNYEGFWTYDQPIIDEVVNILGEYARLYQRTAETSKAT